MWPRSYFAGHYFAPTYWPQSQGTVITNSTIQNILMGHRSHRTWIWQSTDNSIA